MLSVEAYKAIIDGWLQSTAADRPDALGNYAMKRVAAMGAANYADVAVASSSAPKLTALKRLAALQPSTTAHLRAYLQETPLVSAPVAATLRCVKSIGLITGSATNLRFEGVASGAGAPYITVTAPTGSTLPTLTGAGTRTFLQVRHRANTLGVTSIALVQPSPGATLQARAQENVTVTLRSNGLLKKGNVEWRVAQGQAATLSRLGPSSRLTLRAAATLSGLVQTGDYLQLTARTAAPATSAVGSALVGYYRVQTVLQDTLVLELQSFTRASEGIYTPATAPVPDTVNDSFDWQALRVQEAVTFLRHTSPTATFSTTLPGDYLRVFATATTVPDHVLRVQAVVPSANLLLLESSVYTTSAEGGAPYTASTVTPAPDFSAGLTCSFSVTRAPNGQLSLFGVTLPTAPGLGVQTGQYVQLTANPPLTPAPTWSGKYFVISGISGSTLQLANQPYELTPGTQQLRPAGDGLYDTFLLGADAAVYAVTREYPFSQVTIGSPATTYRVLYEVDRTAPAVVGQIRLKRTIHYDYDQLKYELGNLKQQEGSLSYATLNDHFDVDVVTAFPGELFLQGSSASLPPGSDDGDVYVKVSVLAPQVHKAVYKVQAQPLTGFTILEKQPRSGRALEGPGSSFAPYESSSTQAFTEPTVLAATFTATRVVAPLAYAKFVLVDGANAFASVQAQDYVAISAFARPRTVAGYHYRVQSVSADKSTLTLSTSRLRKGVSGENYGAVDLVDAGVLSASELSSFAGDATFSVLRPAAQLDFIQLEGVAYPYAQSPSTTAPAFVTLQLTSGASALTFGVSGTPSGEARILFFNEQGTFTAGRYALGTTPHAFSERRSAPVFNAAFHRQTGQLDKLNVQLSAFTLALPAADRAEVDAALTQLLSPGGSLASMAAVRQVLQEMNNIYADPSLDSPKLWLFGHEFMGDAVRSYTFSGALEAAPTLEVGSDGWVSLTQDAKFQAAVAVAVRASALPAYLKQLDSNKLKNLYVTASLLAAGYSAPQHPNVSNWVTASKPRAFMANKVKAAARAALLLLPASAPQIPAQADSQISALLTALAGLTPPVPPLLFTEAAVSLPETPALSGYPPTLVDGLKATEPTQRRQAVATFISMPRDQSVRVKRGSYARIRARQRARQITLADLQNHLAQTTDPQTRAAIQQRISSLTGQDETATMTALAAEFTNRLVPVPATNVAADSTDLGEQNKRVAEATEGTHVFASSGVDLSPSPLQPGMVPASPASGAGKPAASAPASASAVTAGVTNLFSNDVLDFRVISAALPYNILNAAAFNKTNYATITLCDFNHTNVGLPTDALDATYGTLAGEYNQFKLTGMSESHGEKFQIVDTLSDSFLTFAFGSRPEVWSISGVLIHDLMSDQLAKFRHFYEHHLRISALAKARRKMVLTVPALRIKVYGYAVAFVPQANPEVQSAVSFTLQILVTHWEPFARVSVRDAQAVKLSGLLQGLMKKTAASANATPTLQPPAATGNGVGRPGAALTGAAARAAQTGAQQAIFNSVSALLAAPPPFTGGLLG